MNSTTKKTVARSVRGGLRGRIGVGLLSLGLASGAGVMTMAQPAAAARHDHAATAVVNLQVTRPGLVHTLGVSWS